MNTIDPNWPIFVIVGLLVGETYYAKTVVPRMKALKKAHGLNPSTPMHSRSIRRWEGEFSFLQDAPRRNALYEGINALIDGLRVRLYAVVIDKVRLQKRFLVQLNPYDVSMSQLLSVICGPPRIVGANRPMVARIIAESRGKVEDRQLQSEYQNFRRGGLSGYGAKGIQYRRRQTVRRLFPERVEFAKKSKAIAGLELADLLAYPIGRAVISQNWDNRAATVAFSKLKELVVFP